MFNVLVIMAVLIQGVDSLWTRTYGGTGAEVAYSVIETSDGNYVSTGYTTSFGAGDQDSWLLKLDNKGDTLWTKTFGGAGYDGTHRVIQTSDSGFLVVGFTESFGAGGKDVYLIKTDADGNQQWTKTYGGTLQDVGYACCTVEDGYLISGYIDGPASWTKGDLWILRIDASGDTLWTRRYGGIGEDYGISVVALEQGFIISGTTASFGAGGKDAWLVRITDSGDTMWTKTFGNTGEDVGYSVNIAHDGGYVITGYVDGTGAWTPGDLWIIKTDDNGDEQWRKIYGVGAENFGFGICPTDDGGYALAGLQGSNGGDLWILKTDVSGDTAWTGTWGTFGQDDALSMCVTSDGGYLAAGISIVGVQPDLYLVKTRPVLNLTSPRGGENLPAGSGYEICWKMENSPQPPHSFNLLFSSDGGASYPDTIAAGIDPADTSFDWTVPTDQSTSSRVKIELLSGEGVVVSAAESADNFIIGEGITEHGNESGLPTVHISDDLLTYQLPFSSTVRIVVYDASGRTRSVIVDGFQRQGYHQVNWRLDRLSQGVYFIRFEAGKMSSVKKVIVLQ